MTPPEGERLTSISAGSGSVCGIRPDGGSVICWGGRNSGNPTDETFVSVSTGSGHSCGVLNGWLGESAGGMTTSTGKYHRLRGTGISWESQTGPSHTCGLLQDGSVACWGSGQIEVSIDFPGDGNLVDVYGVDQVFKPAPPMHERVASLSPDGGLCGLRADGTPVCWPSE